jgi:hypothetical protein
MVLIYGKFWNLRLKPCTEAYAPAWEKGRPSASTAEGRPYCVVGLVLGDANIIGSLSATSGAAVSPAMSRTG